ncbi:unnamed protein product [Closterium sp. NIES-53]
MQRLEANEPGGVESEGAESGGAERRGAASSGGPASASPRLSSQQLREWLVQRVHRWSGAHGASEPGDTGAGGATVTSGAGDPTEPGAVGAGGAGAGVAGVGGPGTGGAGAAGAGAVDPGAGGAGGTVRPRSYFVPLLQQVLGVPSSTGLPPPFLCPPPDQSQPPLQPASPLPVPSPYTEQSGGLTERREPASHPVSPVRTARRTPRLRPPPVPSTHTMALRPFSVPLRVPLPAPPESSLPEVPDPESYRARAASPTVARLLATAVTDPSFESAAASALVAELLDVAAACRLDYASALVAEKEEFECLAAAVPRFASLLLAPEGDLDALDIPTPRSYAEAITGPYSSQWQAAMDAEMASWKSTGTYVDEVPPPGVIIVDGMWIFRVKRPPGSPPAFKARYVARGFSQQQGVDYFQTFSPTPKMTSLRVLLHVAAQRDYELHSLDFSTAFLQGSLHEEIWLRRPPGFTGSFLAGTQWSLRRPVYGLHQAPREWHDTLRTTLAALGFAPSTADPSLFLRTGTSLPSFYVLVYVDDLVFATAHTEALTLVKSFSASASSTPRHSSLLCLTATRSQLHLQTSPTSGMGLVLGGRGPVVLTGHADASWVDDSATQRSSQGYTFSLVSGSVSWRSTRSSSFLSSSCEAEIYAGAMASQELRWLTYLLTNLGEQPRSPLVLYVDNKAMIALCQEHRLEQRTKHITLRYFLARELQQRGQLCLAYVATRANTADVFTKALPPGDHQRFVTVLPCFASSLDWPCDHCLVLLSPTSPMGGDRSTFVEMSSVGGTKHVIEFNGAPQKVQGRGTIALLGDGGRRVLVLDVLYVPGVQASLLSAGQLRDSGVQLLDAGDVTLLRAPDGSLLGHAEFKGRVLCTNFQPCSTQQQEGETVALRSLATGVRSKVENWHARLAHVGVDAIEHTAAHGSVTSLELEKGGKSGMPCFSCVGGKITRHTFPSVGEEEDELLGVVHADLCGPFREAAKDGSH